MKGIIQIALCLLWIGASGQGTYFNNRYDHLTFDEGLLTILEIDSGYLSAGRVQGKVTILLLDNLGNEIWSKMYGDSGKVYYVGSSGSMIQTFDEGYALGGNITSSTIINDGMLWRFNKNGDSLWAKQYGDSASEEIFYQCKQTPDSGFVLIGVTTKTGNTDIWLVKTDPSGNMEWEKTFGGSNNENGNSVILTSDGGYLISGSTESFGAGSSDAYVIKVNDTGSVEWDTTYGTPNPDCSFNFIQTSDNNFIGCGCQYDTTLPTSLVQTTPSIMKIDTLGNVVWKKRYGPSRFIAGFSTIHEMKDGSIIATGQSNNNKGTPEGNGFPIGHILKTNANGDSLWYREFEYDSCGCAIPYCDLACSGDTTGVEEFQISNFKFIPIPQAGSLLLKSITKQQKSRMR